MEKIKENKPNNGTGRDDKGRFVPGNSFGSLERTSLKKELRDAIRGEEIKANKSFFQHLAERAFSKDSVLLAVLDRFLVADQRLQLNGEGLDGPTVIVIGRTYTKDEEVYIQDHLEEWKEVTGYKFEKAHRPRTEAPTEEETGIIKELNKKEEPDNGKSKLDDLRI